MRLTDDNKIFCDDKKRVYVIHDDIFPTSFENEEYSLQIYAKFENAEYYPSHVWHSMFGSSTKYARVDINFGKEWKLCSMELNAILSYFNSNGDLKRVRNLKNGESTYPSMLTEYVIDSIKQYIKNYIIEDAFHFEKWSVFEVAIMKNTASHENKR